MERDEGQDHDGSIAATNAEIDRLVYELYGLTEEEIKIVNGKERVAGSGFVVVSGEADSELGPFSRRQAGTAYGHPERHRPAQTGKAVPGGRSFKLLALESAKG